MNFGWNISVFSLIVERYIQVPVCLPSCQYPWSECRKYTSYCVSTVYNLDLIKSSHWFIKQPMNPITRKCVYRFVTAISFSQRQITLLQQWPKHKRNDCHLKILKKEKYNLIIWCWHPWGIVMEKYWLAGIMQVNISKTSLLVQETLYTGDLIYRPTLHLN